MKDIENFMYYMFNKWSYAEALKVFGDTLGEHIYGKYSASGDTLRWYGNLDRGCREKLVARAREIYDK